MIKIPNASQKELEKLLKVREQIETFQNDSELNTYLNNIDKRFIKERNIHTIFSNLKNNKLFKYGNSGIKKNIKEILFAATPLRVLTKGDAFKLYLYLYENELEDEKIQKLIEGYSKENLIITKENFIEFIIKESKNLYTEWNFPIEIKIEYKIYEDVVKKLENPEILNKLAPIILELSRYIDMKAFDEKLREAVKERMLEALPREARNFLKKYKRVCFNKMEKIDNIIFIFLEGKNIISLTIRKDKSIRIELLDKNRYNRVVESEIGTSQQRLKEKTSTYEVKNFNELAKKLRHYGYDIKWIEIDTIPKIFGILVAISGITSGVAAIGYYFGKF